MSSYGYPGPEGPHHPSSAYAHRDRFWSSPPSTGGTDSWGSSNAYTPQLDIASFPNSNYYQGQGPPTNGNNNSTPSTPTNPPSSQDITNLTFSGPSPPHPNQLQPVSYPPSQSPNSNSSSRYTPNSTTPTGQTLNNNNNNNNPINKLNGINGHNSSGSSNSGSPPQNNRFTTTYLDDGGNGGGSNGGGGMQNGHINGGTTTLLSLNPVNNKGMNGGSSRYPPPNDSYSPYYQNYGHGGGSAHPHPPPQNYYYPPQHHNEGYANIKNSSQNQNQANSSSYNDSYNQMYPGPPPTQYSQQPHPQEEYYQHQQHHQNINNSSPEQHTNEKNKTSGGGNGSSPPKDSANKVYGENPQGLMTSQGQNPNPNYENSVGGVTAGQNQNQNENSPNSINSYDPYNNNSNPHSQSHNQNSSPSQSSPPSLTPIVTTSDPTAPPTPTVGKGPKAGKEKGRKNSNASSTSPPYLNDMTIMGKSPKVEDKKLPETTPPKKKRKKRTKNENKDLVKTKDPPYDLAARIKDEPTPIPKETGGKNKKIIPKTEIPDDLDLDLDDEAGADDDKKDVQMVECGCFPADEVHAEPGPFYTHLGAAPNLVELRKLVENRTGFRGNQVRLEKVIYTGKEGKTGHGCPLAKWILRRGSYEEQLLFLVKHRKGHKCNTAWIVVCCVIWEGVPPHFADNLYDTVVYKLNRFGIPTTRRSDTNEQRSCACQGVDPDSCGAAYSFGCAWSMFFNGCKYARSRNVRKFRLTEEHEESELEEKVQHLATHLGPLYERVAPDSYTNQIDHENEGLECRLGYRPGRPFSGVTACLDYCSHAHKDAHNMMNGCTVTVSLTRNRTISKGDDEQYHVLPLYKLDDTDEHGSKEGQKAKVKKGQLEILKKFPCKVRIRKVPLLPSRRRAKAKQAANSAGSSKGESVSGSSTPAPPPVLPPLPPAPSISKQQLTDYADMPPLKREKLFDDRLTNGTMMGATAGENLYGERFGPSFGHSFNEPNPPTSSSAGVWSSPFGGNSGSGASPRGGYFDHSSSPFNPSGPGGGQFSSSSGGASSSLTSLTELTNSTISRHGSSSNLTNLGSSSTASTGSGGSGLLSSPGSSGNPGSASSSGYSSMSPILPSFRNTFMAEESSSGGSSSGGMQSNSSNSNNASHQHHNEASSPRHKSTPTPAFQDHTHSSPYSSSSAYGSQNPYSSIAPPLGGIYHPQPHNPCLPPPLPPPHSHIGSAYPSSAGYHSSHHDPSSPYGGMGMNAPSAYGMVSGWDHHHPAPMGRMGAYSPNYAAAAYSASYPGMNSSNFGMSQMSAMSQYGHMSQHHPYHPQSRQQPNPSSSSWGPPTLSPFSSMNLMNPHHHHGPQGPPPSALAPHHHPQPPPPPSCFVTPPKPKVIPEVNETTEDNEECFKDPQMGGVAIALTHGSVILQCAKHEMHATTALKTPNRMYPSRICMIFYQHKSMNNRFHGWSEWEKKIEAKKLQEVKLINQGKMEASPRKMKQLIKEGYIQDNQ